MTTPSASATREVAPELACLRARREEILAVAAAHGASSGRVFGSVARGSGMLASDIDLLVDFERCRSFGDHVWLWRDLEALLGRRVGVVSAGGLTERYDDIRVYAKALKLVGDLLDAAGAAAEIVARGRDVWEGDRLLRLAGEAGPQPAR